MADLSLEARVLAELRALRKQAHGVTVEALGRSSVICDLLGAGDPYVAYTRLCHEILDSELDLPVKAAAASLGLLAEGDTHLKRLDAFGAEIGMDQRQVRRYSDKGIQTLARLVAMHWPTETVPALTALIVRSAKGWDLHLATARLHIVEMRPVAAVLFTGAKHVELNPEWGSQEAGTWVHAQTRRPLSIATSSEEISIAITWAGELWPKFTVRWVGKQQEAGSESLGNKLMLRIHTPSG
ncbi:MAG: hypothetical protein J0I18_11360 [Actinobacteria bacterium]|nr:hypothetical protein [Actinomycetota bacterium]